MRKHIYVLISVLLWGGSQFLLNSLYQVVSPILTLCLIFFFSGIFLTVFSWRRKSIFSYRYLITGGLGMSVYYLLAAAALSLSSVPFTVVMGGCLPVLALIMDRLLIRKTVRTVQVFSAGLSILGILLHSYHSKLSGNLSAALLMIAANLSWLFYNYLKKRWKMGENSQVLGYEFLCAALLLLPFSASFQIRAPLQLPNLIIFLWVVLFAMVLPYKFYWKGSSSMSLNTSSMYLNLLPVVSLLPSLWTGNLRLTIIQWVGVMTLILSAIVGSRSESE